MLDDVVLFLFKMRGDFSFGRRDGNFIELKRWVLRSCVKRILLLSFLVLYLKYRISFLVFRNGSLDYFVRECSL